ncbi:Mur ligase family protein [Patescibacteria group bacterium]|nr:Mur ligase family protein [Patescibacteria group bacterium]MBU1472832.1 Mur ligase family protein [Patescibacteria group bacterium]MBU2543888.1 Mur ligase family protein [Patescibacteria group bacterium]
MSLSDRIIVIAAKVIGAISRLFGLGAGATWPGEIAITFRPNIARSLASELSDGVILIAGTNGKTTTSLMVKTMLEHIGDSVVYNITGANLLNGVVSSFIHDADWLGGVRANIGIFEIDENSLPIMLKYATPKRIVLLNLFRDQLDRYGEVDVIVEKWKKALSHLPGDAEIILNSDDPGVAFIGKSVKGKVIYFGLNDSSIYLKAKEHATDSTFCPNCGMRLTYDGVYYSHIGVWRCTRCGNKRPDPNVSKWSSPLPGIYNQYNTLAAVALAKSLDISDEEIQKALHLFVPAFGRQEEIVVGSKTVKLFLSKNPAGFNASLRTVLDMGAKKLLLVLNDRIPDGRDVSWIWDVDFEILTNRHELFISGDRCYDLALRLKYANLCFSKPRIFTNLQNGVQAAIKATSERETLFVLATYSAMLEIRKILIGRKIF